MRPWSEEGEVRLPELAFRFCWPGDAPTGEVDNFFLGLWHPDRVVRVEWRDEPSSGIAVRQGANWLMASAASPLHPAGTGLVHAAVDNSTAVAFRGYVLPWLHAYSPSSDIITYWTEHRRSEHNGVFSAAVIEEGGATCTLIVDLFGMGPLYYRRLGAATIFSTNPRYLAVEGDRPDLLAWRSLLETSWIVENRSLSEGIQRVPAGHELCLTRAGSQATAWFPFHRVPRGSRPVGAGAVLEVEEAFQQSIDRCLRLVSDAIALPLSSGFDSRRILAALLRRKVGFGAITCRVLQKGYRDLDATFASQMARDMGFAHTVVGTKSVEQYQADDRARRLLVDAHTAEHTWVLRVMKALPPRPSLFFDGIAGDILGDPVGWSVLTGLAVQQRRPEQEIDEISTHAISGITSTILHPQGWPTVAEVREALKSYLRSFLPRDNLSEVAFLLLRQRRNTALWSQQLLPPGHVAVCPYLDLDYVRLLLDFSSTGKHATKFQRACLREFWPEFYKYPGNRDIPPDIRAGSPALDSARAHACLAALRQEIDAHAGMAMVQDLLAFNRVVVLKLSRYSSTLFKHSSWYLRPLMELVSRQVRMRACWVGPSE